MYIRVGAYLRGSLLLEILRQLKTANPNSTWAYFREGLTTVCEGYFFRGGGDLYSELYGTLKSFFFFKIKYSILLVPMQGALIWQEKASLVIKPSWVKVFH